MRYAQFYRRYSLTLAYPSDKLQPVCGSDGVYIFDGRWGLHRCHTRAVEILRKRGFNAYEIWEGESFTRSRPITSRIEPPLAEVLGDHIPW